VFAAAVVPQVLLLAVAGAVADRLGRRRVMIAADGLRCAAQASLAGAVFAGAANPAARRTLWHDMAEGWAEFRSRTWLWATTLQFAFFNLITWAPWMLLGPVMGRAYLGGAAVWGAIMGVQGAGAITAGLLSLGRRPRRPIVVATIGTLRSVRGVTWVDKEQNEP
jgi:hypothetical protein